MRENDVLQSKVINLLRFPMIVGIVLLHSFLEGIQGLDIPKTGIPIYHNFSFFISRIVVSVAVPLFFFISGYLFFYHVSSFSFSLYKKKLRTRIHTLLIPYLFWNVFILIGHWAIDLLSTVELTSGTYKLVRDYTLEDYIRSFWSINRSMPINGVLWFIRNLMIMVVCSPLVYFVLRYLRWPILVIIGGIWMTGFTWDIPQMSAVFFFTLGSWFSINGRNFVNDFKPILPYGVFLYLLFAIGVLGARETSGFIYVSNAGILLGIVVTIALTAYFIEKKQWHTSAFLTGSCFLVYAFHQLPLNMFVRILFRLIRPIYDWQFLFIYIVSPLIIIAFDLFLYALLKRWFPGFTAAITGGRS